jgi:hypothetical protein
MAVLNFHFVASRASCWAGRPLSWPLAQELVDSHSRATGLAAGFGLVHCAMPDG